MSDTKTEASEMSLDRMEKMGFVITFARDRSRYRRLPAYSRCNAMSSTQTAVPELLLCVLLYLSQTTALMMSPMHASSEILHARQ